MKHNKQSRLHLTALENAKEYFENLVSEREESAGNRSEKWQESENGEQFVSDTENVQTIADNIQSAIDEIESTYEVD